MFGAEGVRGSTGSGAEKRILDVIVVSADHIQIFANGVLGAKE
jgi:hypothetical protein